MARRHTFFDGELATIFQVAALKGNVACIFEIETLQFQSAGVAVVDNHRSKREAWSLSLLADGLLPLIGIDHLAVLHPFAASVGLGENDLQGQIFLFERIRILQSLLDAECRYARNNDRGRS